MKLTNRQKERLPDAVKIVKRLNSLSEFELIKMRLFAEELAMDFEYMKHENSESENNDKKDDTNQN